MKIIASYIDASGLNSEELITRAMTMQNRGIDRLMVTDFTDDESARDRFLENARALSRAIDIPFIIGTSVRRFEDIKKAFYTGAGAVLIRMSDVKGTGLIKEGCDRFKPQNIFVLDGLCGINGIGEGFEIIECSDLTEKMATVRTMEAIVDSEEETDQAVTTDTDAADGEELSRVKVNMAVLKDFDYDIMVLKRLVAELGIEVNTFTTDITFESLKKNSDGLVPCIVQDYKNGEVLMMAWMDEEAYNATIATGVMTYHSRSRNELWIKGKTSGHYQYLKELKLDCDSDTLLAKVYQVGAACHTGNRSCFFNTLIKHESNARDISEVLSSLYDVVMDRKQNPKEGSYTNYLFDKGIDKILKKCGEEATEMVIAAKNPNAEELKYEIADLLYHMTVLMVECGVDWNDVATELANR